MATLATASTAELDSLITLLADCPSDECRIAEEHVHAARFYLLGAMRKEYILSLDLTRAAVALIPSEATRKQAERILAAITS